MRLSTLVGCVFALLLAPQVANAAALRYVSDLISTSQPNATSTQQIIFTTTNAVPPSGTIEITPQGAFVIPVGLDYTDIDVAVSSGGPYVDRDLAAVASATEEGVQVVSGASGSITITLNSTDGLLAGDAVRVRIGTNAIHQTIGDDHVSNPATPGSYRIEIATTDGANVIDFGKAMIMIITPITTSMTVPDIPPGRFNGLPSGQIAAGTNFLEISLETDELSTCRYATSSGITYAAMTNQFTSVGNVLFYATVSGHSNGATFTYYVKCSDIYGIENTDDYLITFSVASTPPSNTSIGNGLTGTGGSGGVGPIPYGSATLFKSNVTLSGWGPIGGTVTILKDGVIEGTTITQSDGRFSGNVPNLERGTYTFLVYALDAFGRRTGTYTSTLTVGAGTTNTISNIILSPTLALESDSVPVDGTVRITGDSVPGSKVEVTIKDAKAKGALGGLKRYEAQPVTEGVGARPGLWQVTVDAAELSQGTHEVRAIASLNGAKSDLSAAAFLGVGEEPSSVVINAANRSDINKDGKVNLVDFSILLSFWNTDNENADINEDGNINLSDFSILLFNWTG